MFKKILIANRGEIAVRIIRTCHEMGIETVAIYSTSDRDCLHVQLATQAVCIGPSKSSESYLKMDRIIQVAMATGCDAIHPGFGFLSENADFVEMVEACGLVFIGPSAASINALGNKMAARTLMIAGNVPVVPGSLAPLKSLSEAKEIALEVGYPILIKASAGGGGRGMRIAHDESEMESAYNQAKLEAKQCFLNDEVYLEKLILNPKHIEIQILADHFGNVIHLGERDCSIQRRNQKIIEEAPSCVLTPELREQMGLAAINAAKAADYTNAGTVEFVYVNGEFYFIEMNTRIQVEHPITEMITGIDIVREQIRVEANLKLALTQEQVKFNGVAIECRINAEDFRKGFIPTPGRVENLHFPGGFGVRIDSLLYQGYRVSPFYDSMVAKIIVHGSTRLEAIRKMRRALEELVITGFTTNQELLYMIMHSKDYVKGNFDTGFIEAHIDEYLQEGAE